MKADRAKATYFDLRVLRLDIKPYRGITLGSLAQPAP
jgi:hypothetical protein